MSCNTCHSCIFKLLVSLAIAGIIIIFVKMKKGSEETETTKTIETEQNTSDEAQSHKIDKPHSEQMEGPNISDLLSVIQKNAIQKKNNTLISNTSDIINDTILAPIDTKLLNTVTTAGTQDMLDSHTSGADELRNELPEDLKAQLNAPPSELPEDIKEQLTSLPPELPEDIKRALETPPRVVTFDEVNNTSSE